MHEIQVSVASPEAADHGVAELSAAGESIGFTILEDGDLMLHIEPRRDHAPVVVGARSLARGAHSSLPPARTGLTHFFTHKRSSDARIDPTEALHDGAARNHRPPRRHRWGSCLLLLELSRGAEAAARR